MGEFSKKFAGAPAEAIAYAFDKWRDSSPFFPAISDIRELIAEWRVQQGEAAASKRIAEEMRQEREAREKGETVGYADVLRKFGEIVNRKKLE